MLFRTLVIKWVILDNYSTILEKLNAFIAKFYTKMLLKGVILFVTLGLLFFLVILGIEYFLWLNSLGRLVLLILFVGVELFFLWKYIITPLFFLFRWRRGLTNKEASLLIGKHFAGVDDKLFNLLELAECSHKSELLLASIQQRSTDLSMVPFVNAIDFKDSIRYTKFLLIPFFIVGLIWLAGDVVSYFSSYQRVVNYDLAYEPPAPFTFKVFSTTLDVLEGESLTVSVTTEGRIKPESISIVVNGKELLLQTKDGFSNTCLILPLRARLFILLPMGLGQRSII